MDLVEVLFAFSLIVRHKYVKFRSDPTPQSEVARGKGVLLALVRGRLFSRNVIPTKTTCASSSTRFGLSTTRSAGVLTTVCGI